MRYLVSEIYTPDDTDLDRKRESFEFESESTDLFELAVQARAACCPVVNEETLANIRKCFEFDDVREQISDQKSDGFSFSLFGNHGEWEVTVEAKP